MLHDGRVTKSDTFGNGFNTPAQELLPKGLDNIVAVQAWTATILSSPFGSSSCAGVLKPLPNVSDLVTLPSWSNVVISLNPKFHNAKAFLGML